MRPPVFELVRQGLSSAVLGMPASSVKNAKNGLFPNNQNGRDAASFISEMGLMDGNVGEEGATHQVTTQGFQWLREQGAPVINDFLQHLEQWKDQDRALVSKVKENIARLDQLTVALKAILGDPMDGSREIELVISVENEILAVLTAAIQKQSVSENGSCDIELPVLYREVEEKLGRKLTSGTFQDVIRKLHFAGKILLHPWTGTLYSIPEPAMALLVGHEVTYYASSAPG